MKPIAIATWAFGKPAVETAYQRMIGGASALDAVEAGINVVELDPEVQSVGYGGLPNSDGDVEMDAAIMDGPGHPAGSVAALRDIRTPISVARCVMEQSPHVMLVGEGALQFALAHGFQQQPTLTAAARADYDSWKLQGMPLRWLGSHQVNGIQDASEFQSSMPNTQHPTPNTESQSHDTIGLAALDLEGRLAVGCSTSGLAFKSCGRVGDSPIIGSGLYVDQEVGAAAATGVGELILRFCLSHLIVENMRIGLTPQQACNLAILRLLETDSRYGNLQIGVIALSRIGEVGAASTRPAKNPLVYAVASRDGVSVRDANIPF